MADLVVGVVVNVLRKVPIDLFQAMDIGSAPAAARNFVVRNSGKLVILRPEVDLEGFSRGQESQNCSISCCETTAGLRECLCGVHQQAGSHGLFVDFLDANGNVLQTQKYSVSGPFASDATQALNQHHVSAVLSNAALFKIRLQCGTLSQGVLNGTVVRTYSLGPAVGTVEGVPFDQAVRAGAPTTYGVKWTVPDPDNWRSLSQMDVRLVDKAGQASIRVHEKLLLVLSEAS